MRVIARSTPRKFWDKHGGSEQPLKAWFQEAKQATWRGPHDIKAKYHSTSILKNNRVVFNVGGNTYRLIVRINYRFGVVYIRFVGTHEDYDRVNAEEI
jgi:mRNA interferase HigB